MHVAAALPAGRSRRWPPITAQGPLLRLERAAAAAGLHRVGILEGKAALLEPLVVVDRGAVQIERAFLVDDNRDAVILVLRVELLVELVVEPQVVAEAAAAAAHDANAQQRAFGRLLFVQYFLDFAGGPFAQNDGHG